MKRIIIIIASICLAVGSLAQNDSLATGNSFRRGPTLNLGISAGATLYANGNDMSPYYSNHGFTLQIPCLLGWEFAPHWKLSTGLRYDFSWDPLYYAVEPVLSEWTFEEPYEEYGLQFRQTPTTGTQKAYAYRSHIGIPVEIKWYPWAEEKKRLGIALDLFAAYAVTQYFDIEDITFTTEDNGRLNRSTDGYHSSLNAMNPWKLEVGLSLTTGLIGLTHGIRFFTNLLPTYTDPTSGEKIYTSGMTFFL